MRYLVAAALLLLGGVVLALSLWFWPRIERLLSPTTPVDPDDEERPDSGADEKFGAELRALKAAPVAPELVTDTEMDLHWALIWHDCEHRWQAEVNRIFTEAQAELQRPRTFDEVRELVAA